MYIEAYRYYASRLLSREKNELDDDLRWTRTLCRLGLCGMAMEVGTIESISR